LAISQVAVACEARCGAFPCPGCGIRNNGIPDGSIVDGHDLKFDAIILVILDGIADDLDILNMGTGAGAVLSDAVVKDPCDRITLDGQISQIRITGGPPVFDINPLS